MVACSAGRVLEESAPPAELAGPAACCLKLMLLEGTCIFMGVVVLKCVVISYIIITWDIPLHLPAALQ